MPERQFVAVGGTWRLELTRRSLFIRITVSQTARISNEVSRRDFNYDYILMLETAVLVSL